MLHHSPTRSRPRAMGHCMLPKLFRRMGDTWHSHYHDASDSPAGRAVAPRDGRRPPRRNGRARVRYRMFGERTGLRVSELGLGGGNFGTRWGYGAEPEEARRIFDRFAEAGGNFLDCADAYQFGQAETLLGQFVAADRDHFVLATKYTLGAEPEGGVSRTGNGRKNMVRSVEASLKRLGTDRIDLYWAHMADGTTPTEEIARGFEDLVRAGKVLHVGLSDFPAWRVARAATLAELRGWAPVGGIQVAYSLVERTPARGLLPMAEALGLAVTAWSPLGGGLLSGKYRRGEAGRVAALGNPDPPRGGPRGV